MNRDRSKHHQSSRRIDVPGMSIRIDRERGGGNDKEEGGISEVNDPPPLFIPAPAELASRLAGGLTAASQARGDPLLFLEPSFDHGMGGTLA